MKRIFIIMLSVLLIFSSCKKNEEIEDDGRLKITALNFPSFDAARAIVGEDADLFMLMPSGSEVHTFEPTAEDVIRIIDSDIFIYTGGESDEWINGILSSLTEKTHLFSLMDNADHLLGEDEVGIIAESDHDHDHESGHKTYDEHVWTSIENYISIIESLKDLIVSLDAENAASYEERASSYIEKLNALESEYSETVENAKRKTLIFADRFPFLYLAEEFGLSYFAAFPGCSDQTEASAKTVARLIDKVKEEGIPVVLHLELSNTMLSNVVADESGAAVMELNSAQNISRHDFNSGLTYLEILENNLNVLKEALN